MQGAEMEDEGSVLKYMTKSQIEEQRSSLLMMTQRPVLMYITITSSTCPPILPLDDDSQRQN